MMEKFSLPVRMMASATFGIFGEKSFLTKKVGDLMWGYDSQLVDFLNNHLPGMLPSKGKFGLFAEVSDRTGLCYLKSSFVASIWSEEVDQSSVQVHNCI